MHKASKTDSIDLFSNSVSLSNALGSSAETQQSKELAESYWTKCLEIIRDNVSGQVFRTWFEPLKAIAIEDSKLTVRVPSYFFCEWIEEHFYPLLQKTLQQVIGDNAKLQYHVVVDDNGDSLEKRTVSVPGFKHGSQHNQSSLPFAQTPIAVQEFPTFLNPRYSFDSFIRGECNQLASSAALAVSQNPGGTRFNPLFIYGDTGVGKTHLAQAIGNFVIQKNRKARVLYTTSERFTMEFVNAIQNNKSNEFINFYRSIDVLIVDDIQFFAGKEKTQDNFFHTFNALHQAGKQIVLTSDRPPRNLSDVDDRLISRFQWGLTVDIQSPDLEMRMAILQKKSLDEGWELTPEIIEFIARNVTHSVRELEGILISLTAKVTLDRREMTLDLAKEVVFGIASNEPRILTMDDIKDAVSVYYNIPVSDIESKNRKHEITLSRQMCMYLAKQLTQLSLKSIGSNFGGRDHSTVLHSCQTIENYLITDRSVKHAFEALMKKLKTN